MKPMHPESISMIGELAGLADWMDLMNTTIKKADEIYSQQAGQVSNRTTASLIHKLGNAYLQVRTLFYILLLISTELINNCES